MTRAESLGLALAIVACGCGSVTSIRPLYTDDDLKAPIAEPRIEGEWVSLDLDTPDPDEKPSHRWKITSRPDVGDFSVEVTPVNDGTNDGVYVFDVRLVRIADAMYFDAELNVHKEGGPNGRDRVASILVPTHVVGSIRMEQDLRISVLNATWVKEHSAEDWWISFSNGFAEDDLVLTGSTEDVRSLLVRHADNPEAFHPIYLCRPGAECKPRIIEDLVARSPDDNEVLEYAAEFFAVSGNRERAIALRRRVVAIQPNEPRPHADLAEAYLLNRDFAGARQEYAAARALSAGHADEAPIPAFGTAADIAWSHFLEGEYAEVVSTARSDRVSGPLASADPPLLAYYSLIRLGHSKEALALLTEVTATFVGPSEDQLLLLDTRGRLSDRGAPAGERGAFYRALRELAAGRPDHARHHFAAADPTRHDSRIALAARIELERLEQNLP